MNMHFRANDLDWAASEIGGKCKWCALAADEQALPDTFAEHPNRFKSEPYRRKLSIIHYRLGLNLAAVSARLNAPDTDPATQVIGYTNELELLQDLQLIRDSLISNGDANVADGEPCTTCESSLRTSSPRPRDSRVRPASTTGTEG